MPRSVALRGIVTAAVAAATAVASPSALASPVAPASVNCDGVASVTGSDAAAGTTAAPFRTAAKLAASVPAGGTGCLRAGTFAEDLSVGRSDITLTSFPGERATLKGRLWIKRGADRVTISSLDLDGVNSARLPSPTVNSADARFLGNDVTNEHTEICFNLGHETWGRAVRTVLKGNRIHGCGAVPSTNLDHGVYVANSDAVQILDNVIYDNTDRGIQLYPDAQGTVIRGNIIDANGEGIIFSGADGTAANDTTVGANVISNSRLRANVESWYPAANPIGTGNVVTGNCLSGGIVDTSSGGFTATANVTADPGFAAAGQGDFRMASSGPCAAIMAASSAPAGPDWQAPVSAGAAATDPSPSPAAAVPAPASAPTPIALPAVQATAPVAAAIPAPSVVPVLTIIDSAPAATAPPRASRALKKATCFTIRRELYAFRSARLSVATRSRKTTRSTKTRKTAKRARAAKKTKSELRAAKRAAAHWLPCR